MARIRKGDSLGVVARRQHVNEAGEREPRRVIEFPKPPAAEDVVSDKIIFEIGRDRFAITWSAVIELLPPAGPVPVEPEHKTACGP